VREASQGGGGTCKGAYRNVHGRDPDPEGYAFWLGLLQSGTISRAQLLVGFSESPEFRQRSGIA